MSTKAYDWYKIKRKGDFWPMVKWIHHKGRLRAKDKLRDIYLELVPGVEVESDKFKADLAESAKHLRSGITPEMAYDLQRLNVVHNMMREGYKRSKASPYRDLFDFDVWVRFCEYGGRVYLNAHADMMMRGCMKFISEDRRVEDYSYWNNSDKPDEVTERTWRKRKKVWDVLGDRMTESLLVLEVVTHSSFYEIDPYFAICKEVADGKLVLPPVKAPEPLPPNLRIGGVPVSELLAKSETPSE